MPFLLAEILNFQGSTHRIGVGSFSYLENAPMKTHPLQWRRVLPGIAVPGGRKKFLAYPAAMDKQWVCLYVDPLPDPHVTFR